MKLKNMVEAKTKLLFILVLVLSITGCGKDDCLSNIEDESNVSIYYNSISCTQENFTRLYTNEDDYFNDLVCSGLVPLPLDFNGIIIVQGVKVPYISENENIKKAYSLDLDLCRNECEKSIDFHFILENVDTFQRFEHNEDVLVVLDDVDENYAVNFSHEIIPFAE